MFKKMILGLALVSTTAMATTPAPNAQTPAASAVSKASVKLTAQVPAMRTIQTSGEVDFGDIDDSTAKTANLTLTLNGNKNCILKMQATGKMKHKTPENTKAPNVETINYSMTLKGTGAVTLEDSAPKIESFTAYEAASKKIADVAFVSPPATATSTAASIDTVIIEFITVPNGSKRDGDYEETITFEVAAS